MSTRSQTMRKCLLRMISFTLKCSQKAYKRSWKVYNFIYDEQAEMLQRFFMSVLQKCGFVPQRNITHMHSSWIYEHAILNTFAFFRPVAVLENVVPETESICGALAWKFFQPKLFFKLPFVKTLMPQSCALYLPVQSEMVSICLQIFLLKTIYFTKNWFLAEHTLNILNTSFT